MWEPADIEAINTRLKAIILAHAPETGKHPCAVPGLHLSRLEATNELRVFHSPFIGLTVQGGKRTLVGAEEYCYGEYHCFVASFAASSR